MNEIQIFNHPRFGEVEIIEIEGSPFFGATKTAASLGYSNPHDAISRHCRTDGVVKREVIDSMGRTQEMNFITEGNLYRLITKSKLPDAEKYEVWVFDEVLPSIRKTGSYSVQQFRLPQTMAEALRLAADLVDQNQTLQLENEELKTKTRYVDQILLSKGTVTITQIAKDYGMAGPQLNKILHEEKVQYKQNRQWLLYSKYQAKGFVKSETIDITRSNGDPDVTMNTRWTQKGRLFIHELLTKRGILAEIDKKQAS